jgi:hypothetical protein
MTNRPILFSGPMIRALLDGRKTQTRRVIRGVERDNCMSIGKGKLRTHVLDAAQHPHLLPIRAAAGDRLWVREAHALLPRTAYRASIGTGTIDQREHPTDGYTAALFREGFDRSGSQRWRPSIHMPRWASRLTLTVTDVRVQRVQEITLGDICAEGLARSIYDFTPVQRGLDAFAELWDSLNAARGYSWDANPWVAAYTFTVHRQNIDQMGEAA